MRVVTNLEAIRRAETVRRELPGRILRYIALCEPCHPLHLRRVVERWLPGDMGAAEVERISQIVDWLEERGDICIGARGSLRCMPPYCVGSVENAHLLSVRLCGNPGVEAEIEGALGACGVYVDRRYTTDGFGIYRSLTLPDQNRLEVAKLLDSLSVRILTVESLLENLSRVSEFSLPSEELFRDRPPVHGVWSAYDPSVAVPYQAGRWRPISDLAEATDLARWAPEESTGKPWLRRYFLHYHDDLAMEITSDLAKWWSFVLDDLEGRPTTWLYDEPRQVLVINGALPQEVSRVLHLLSDGPVTFDGYEKRYSINRSHLASVRRIAEEHLGIRFRIQA